MGVIRASNSMGQMNIKLQTRTRSFLRSVLFASTFSFPILCLVPPAEADRWDDVRDAKRDLKKEQNNLYESYMDLRKEQRGNDWRGIKEAQRSIRKNKQDNREAQADYNREVSEARYGNRRDRDRPRYYQGNWGSNYSSNHYYGTGYNGWNYGNKPNYGGNYGYFNGVNNVPAPYRPNYNCNDGRRRW